jgi:hypothetical protein
MTDSEIIRGIFEGTGALVWCTFFLVVCWLFADHYITEANKRDQAAKEEADYQNYRRELDQCIQTPAYKREARHPLDSKPLPPYDAERVRREWEA